MSSAKPFFLIFTLEKTSSFLASQTDQRVAATTKPQKRLVDGWSLKFIRRCKENRGKLMRILGKLHQLLTKLQAHLANSQCQNRCGLDSDSSSHHGQISEMPFRREFRNFLVGTISHCTRHRKFKIYGGALTDQIKPHNFLAPGICGTEFWISV